MRLYVFSRTLKPEDYPDVTVIGDDAGAALAGLRKGAGKDIWLMGGGVLFRSLLEVRLVDTVEVKVVPILLGKGIPLLPPPSQSTHLKLTRTETLASGSVRLGYAVDRNPA
jgi:dihydrofolate reductase